MEFVGVGFDFPLGLVIIDILDSSACMSLMVLALDCSCGDLGDVIGIEDVLEFS